jgi:hypothetical protein
MTVPAAHLLDQATALVDEDALVKATIEVASNEEAWIEANDDPGRYLEQRGIAVPEGLTVRALPWPGFGKPSPDWHPFAVRLTMCKTVWVRDPDSGVLRQEQVCRGFEVIPNPLPGGPIA